MTLDELRAFGMTEMSAEQIRDFLRNEGRGVLALPADDVPYLVPLSYGYDGESTLYFTFLVGTDSRKRELAERATRARFLVHNVSSSFVWESLVLTGSIDRLPASEWTAHEDDFATAWRPDLFERAREEVDVEVYRFEIADRVGIKHAGLPPGLRGDGTDDPTT